MIGNKKNNKKKIIERLGLEYSEKHECYEDRHAYYHFEGENIKKIEPKQLK